MNKARLLAASLMLGLSFNAGAQAYPAKPLRFVVPALPGGNLDMVARTTAQKVSEGLGRQVLVENRPGNIVGAQYVARSPADGYTFLVVSNAFATIPSVASHAGYSPEKDFTGVSLLALIPLVLVVNPALPAKSVKELIAIAKAHPNSLAYGGSGIGSAGHITAELFARQAGIKLLHVPYKGNAQSLVDLMAGQIALMFDQLSTSAPHINRGKLRALAVTTTTRSPLFPNLPTVAESGLPGYESVTYNGVVAPIGTPADALTRLHAEIVKALLDTDIKARLLKQGVEVNASASPEAFSAYLRRDVAKMAKIVREAGIKGEE
jgi:tripartite-type tricarboxylate transporter receptor subunit TctC